MGETPLPTSCSGARGGWRCSGRSAMLAGRRSTVPARPREWTLMTAPTPASTTASGLPWSADRQMLPLLDLEGSIGERVRGLGARQVNLYRSLAHVPDLLQAWMDWAW